MRLAIKLGIVTGSMALGWILCAATGQDKKVVFADSSKLEYKSLAPGASSATVVGDAEKGKHSGFTKFEPGAKFDMHSHSSDMRIVVIKGAYLYKGKNGVEHRVGPGSCLVVPGGDHHWSGGDEKDGALFFMDSDGKFDLIPDKK